MPPVLPPGTVTRRLLFWNGTYPSAGSGTLTISPFGGFVSTFQFLYQVSDSNVSNDSTVGSSWMPRSFGYRTARPCPLGEGGIGVLLQPASMVTTKRSRTARRHAMVGP